MQFNLHAGCRRQPVSADDVARMSAEDIFSFRQQYGNRARQLLREGAESPSSALHAELLRLVALWVRPWVSACLPENARIGLGCKCLCAMSLKQLPWSFCTGGGL